MAEEARHPTAGVGNAGLPAAAARFGDSGRPHPRSRRFEGAQRSLRAGPQPVGIRADRRTVVHSERDGSPMIPLAMF
jgi:hypothetical protein